MNNPMTVIPPSLQPIETKGRWEVLGMDLVCLVGVVLEETPSSFHTMYKKPRKTKEQRRAVLLQDLDQWIQTIL
jgi:hypothetical protein